MQYSFDHLLWLTLTPFWILHFDRLLTFFASIMFDRTLDLSKSIVSAMIKLMSIADRVLFAAMAILLKFTFFKKVVML